VEVFIALMGKGYIIEGMHWPLQIVGFFMIGLSMAKAYLIIFEFMHMKYEAQGLVRSVLLPTLLLVWGIIAFLWEGDTWGERRSKDEVRVEMETKVEKGHSDDTHDPTEH
jgi:cytochrome c oxidase subunit IV